MRKILATWALLGLADPAWAHAPGLEYVIEHCVTFERMDADAIFLEGLLTECVVAYRAYFDVGCRPTSLVNLTEQCNMWRMLEQEALRAGK